MGEGSPVKTSAVALLHDCVAGPRVALLQEGFLGHAPRRKAMPLWLRIGRQSLGAAVFAAFVFGSAQATTPVLICEPREVRLRHRWTCFGTR